ncbi:MAG: hypothetical protein ACLVGK_02830 [Pilosibacter sp.]
MKKRKKLGAERLSEFFRQFSVLVESGLSIPETLEIMQQDDTDREFCLACRKLGAFMTEGKTVVSYRITCNNGNQRTLINP